MDAPPSLNTNFTVMTGFVGGALIVKVPVQSEKT
jgi:hypothetical protein